MNKDKLFFGVYMARFGKLSRDEQYQVMVGGRKYRQSIFPEHCPPSASQASPPEDRRLSGGLGGRRY